MISNKNYFDDMPFLKELYHSKVREQYVEIVLLSYDEKPIKSLIGTIQSGSININGDSSVRRTINLTAILDSSNLNIDSLQNDFSLEKKIKVRIGLKNNVLGYEHYGDIIWFPQGIFVLTECSLSSSTGNCSISIKGTDKMVLLDGNLGGTLPSTITLHEKQYYDTNGEIVTEQVLIYDIIKELVHHLGKEDLNKIIINDLPQEAKLLMKYMGEQPIYFNSDYTDFSFVYNQEYYNKRVQGEDIGYTSTPLVYPGELIANAGETIVSVLDKIKNQLNNFEYFYDLDGNFVFQQKKNYLNTSSPLDEIQKENYVYTYSNTKSQYVFSNLGIETSVNKNPKYSNIKNDFIVQGTRKLPSGANKTIRYRLVIDQKPQIFKANFTMYHQIDETTGAKINYYYIDNNGTVIGTKLEGNYKNNIERPSAPEGGWREEMYRNALEANALGNRYSDYDAELIAEWNDLFNPNVWEGGWNPQVKSNPQALNYWLDFIDTGSKIGIYNVNNIGRRTVVKKEDKISCLYAPVVPDIIYNESNVKINDELIATSGTGINAYEKIREMLYQHLVYNITISINCIPIYTLEPNQIIYVANKEAGVYGNYEVVSLTIPLGHKDTMSINANELLVRV